MGLNSFAYLTGDVASNFAQFCPGDRKVPKKGRTVARSALTLEYAVGRT